MAAPAPLIAKRCAVCGRGFDYALTASGDLLHCPRCGKRLRGRDEDFE